MKQTKAETIKLPTDCQGIREYITQSRHKF